MSTKTTFKRIALVAVASLGFGLLSVVPSNAALIVTPTTQTATFGALTRSGIATWDTTATVTATLTAGFDAADTIEVSVGTLAGAAKGTATAAVIATTGLVVAGGVGTYTFAADATSITFTANVRFTAATDTAVANVAAAAGTYTVPLKVGDVSDALSGITTGVDVVIGSTAALALFAPVAGTGSTSSALVQQVNGQATVNFVDGTSDVSFAVTTSGVGTIISATATGATVTAPANLNGTSPAGGVSWTPVTTTQNLAILTSSTVPGVQTITIQPILANGVPGTAVTATITWGAAVAVSTQYSAVRIGAGVTGNGTAITSASASDALVATVVSRTVAAAQKFTIRASTFDQYNAALTVSSFSATITGPGLISIENDDSSTAVGNGRSVSTTVASNTATVAVWSDGTSGASTISIYAGTVLLGTKVVTFVGSATTATATQYLKVAATGTRLGAVGNTDHTVNTLATAAFTPAFKVSVTDANGINVAAGSTVWTMTSSDSTKIVVGTCAEYATYPGNFECSVSAAVGALSGASATVTFAVLNSTTLLYDIVAAPLTFSVGGAIASTVVTLDKASYSPGEAMVLTVVSKDSTGFAAYDGQAVYSLISSNKSLGGALPLTTKFIIGGTYASSATAPVVFAPSVDGSFFIAGTTVPTLAAPLGIAFQINATVENGVSTAASQAAADAAAEATDAANAATDAANAAAEAADAATAAAQDAADAVAALSVSVTAMVDALRKQITSLTNLVIKIQKKVKA
jgi:hypothetical protein